MPPEKIQRNIGIGHLEGSWNTLAKVGMIFATLAATFISPPPENLLTATKGGVDPLRFAGFLLVVVLGFIVLLMAGWNKKRHYRRWGMLAGATFLMTIVAAFLYMYTLHVKTTMYDGRRVIIGTAHTPAAVAHIKNNPSLGNAQLVMDAAGQIEDVWTIDSIATNVGVVLAIYLMLFVSAGATALCISQAIYCAQKPR